LNIPLRIAWAGFWLAPTSVTMISFEQTSETWAAPKCLTFGDTSHLYESGLDVKWKGVRKHR
jgi:probable phosphoglycerate mutase